MKLYQKNTIFVLLFSVLLLTVGSSVNAEVDSPKKQMKMGVQIEDIVCKTGLELVIRTNGFPACVRAETAEKMEKLGMIFIHAGFAKSEKETVTVPASNISTVPASNMSTINFYITDHDLNLAHGGVDVVPTKGLFEFTINGMPISGPESIIETGPDTGQFYVKLELPETINGEPLSQDDVVLIKYMDASDSAGEKRILVKSVLLKNTFAKVQTSSEGNSSRIGHYFTVRIYEPDANTDSKDENKISLNAIEYRGEGGIRTTLGNPAFDANRGFLVETGPNTDIFEVKIKIPRQLDGQVVHIGDWYELRYIDRSTPSNTDEKIILKGKIG